MLMFTNAHSCSPDELGAQAVDVVVVAAHRNEVGAVHAGGEHLLLLEVGRDEHVGLEAGGRGVGGDRVGEVAGRGAGHGLEPELARAGQRHRHDPVLERVGGVGGVVLDPHLAQAELLGEAVGPQQRRPAGGQRPRAAAPAPAGSRCSATANAARPGSGGEARPDRPSCAARRPPRAGRSTARRRTAPRAGRLSYIPCNEETLAAYEKTSAGVSGRRSRKPPYPHLPGLSLEPDGIGTFPLREVAGVS